ncbi:MAG TPA: metallophosphoesterase [Solirubrobacteraceae bacterium]|nr:metallophosphoesterase [Solirubrobacteraceae bacterium]
MRTLIVSDLHLGAASGVDLLRRPELREPLLAQLGDVDRLVLLGDVLELRHGPRREALQAARDFFADLGRALGEREIVVLAGNHDHALIEPWLERRSELPAQGPLALEQRFAAAEGSAMLAQLAHWATPARLTGAYPGLWLRQDVYATHGHYLDCHLTIPTMERLGIGAMGRLLRRPARAFDSPDDYEAVTVPVFAWIDAVARQATTGDALNGGMTVRAWRVLNGEGSRNGGGLAATLRTRALAAGFPLAVAALNRAGLGPFNADLSSGELRRAGLRAMGEVALRLGLGEAHVIFGHTHRPGPLPGDAAGEWRGPGGARLMNTGCWTYDAYFLTSTPGESPYWPGCCVVLDDDAPPRLLRLLADRPHAELMPLPA